MNIEFKSLKELYDRLKPALNNKAHELNMMGYKYINSDDIWNYFKEIKWSKSHNLLLYEMVEDILNADPIEIDEYFKDKVTGENRVKYFE